MTADDWPTKRLAVTSLRLDEKNPRLGREVSGRAPREIIQYLFDHDKAYEIAESIAANGYFPNEPLLAVWEDNHHVVVEGNRRLAALKALREPGLLEGAVQRRVERLSRAIAVTTVPVTIAPSRKATDRLLVVRHIGTPVLAWQSENRASFILDKLNEGYDNESLTDDLGFTAAQIQEARQIRALADMLGSLPLDEDVKAKIASPRGSSFSALQRVFDSSVGRGYLQVETDSEHGFRGKTTSTEFVRGVSKLVADVALGKETTRSLNTNEDIKAYFEKRNPDARVAKKRGSFVPADVIEGKSVASSPETNPPKSRVKSRQVSASVLPRDLKVRYGPDRIVDIRNELTKLKRDVHPNAGVVLLRVFIELCVVDYLKRTGELPGIIERIERKTGKKLRFDAPEMSDLAIEVRRIAKARLTRTEAEGVIKAFTPNAGAAFNISDLHAFVHRPSSLPTARDIQQFWLLTEPLFRLMLEQEPEGSDD